MEQFSPELIAILGVGVAVLSLGVAVMGLVLHQGRRLDRRIDALAVHMNEQIRQTNEQIQILSDRVARIEGKHLFETFIAHRSETPTVAAE